MGPSYQTKRDCNIRVLSASRTTVREGDAAITITARLARNAEAERVIHISHGSNHGLDPAKVQQGLTLATVATACTPVSPDKDYTLSPAAITIPAGQRTGTATLTVCDDTTEDSGEYISLRPGNLPQEAYPTSGSGAYQVQSLQITILNDETGNQPPEQPQPQPDPEPAASAGGKYAALIAQMRQWRNDPQWVSYKSHTDRWDRALLAFGETVADASLTPMTAAEAQGYADEAWGTRWVPVAAALHEIESAGQQPQQQTLETPSTWSVTGAASAAEGSSATLTVTLDEAAPAGGVSFTVTADYGGDATATFGDVGSITSPVTVAQGNTTLDIAIPTASDDVDEDDETFTVTVAAVTDGWTKAGAGRDTATVTIQDDDTAGVTVSPAALNVSEGGSGAYTVVLNSQPTADVVVTPSSSDGGAASASPASHTFTATNWNAAKTFTMSGVADDDRNDESVSVSHGVASSDAKYGGIAAASVSVAVSDTTPEPQPQENPTPEPEAEPQENAGPEPTDVRVVPGDGILTVTWTVAPRPGVSNGDIRHALRWSQESGVWANPQDARAGGPEDGVAVAGGVTTYTITGLKNGVATGVFVRSFTGGSYSERSQDSSQWVRTKGDHTTPKAAE